MAAPTPSVVPVVEIELLGETRHLRLDFAGIAAAERATGKSFLRSTSIAMAGANELTAILWGCLLHEDPDLKLEDVRSWITYANAGYLAETVMDAVLACFPAPDGDEDGDDGASDPTETAPRGRSSGRSRASSSASRRKNSGD